MAKCISALYWNFDYIILLHSDRFNKTCVPFKSGDKVGNDVEFAKIECFNSSSNATFPAHIDFHNFAPLKGLVEDRCSKISTSDDQVCKIKII
jgi:hypothetical protein